MGSIMPRVSAVDCTSYELKRSAECESCGVQLVAGAAFCASCGRPVAQAPGTFRPIAPVCAESHANIAGALCYAAGLLTGVVFLAFRSYRREPFVRFHAFQSIFLSIAWLLVHFALGGLIALAPWTAWHLIAMLSRLVSFAFLGITLFLIFKAFRTEHFKLPLIGDLAEKHSQP